MDQRAIEHRLMPWCVWSVAFVLRFLHTESLLADPLYFNPLGGNVPYLRMAQSISAGNLLPVDGAFTVNSPLYPYFLTLLYQVFGEGAFFQVRLVTALVDAGTCVLVAILARRHFGPVAGWAGGLALACFGPMIFFATDLTPVPLTLFLLTLALVVLDRRDRSWAFLLAGLLFGLAAGTRPNVLVAGLLALGLPWVRGSKRALRLSAALAAGLILGVAPVTMANWAASGRPVLLTLSAGHNFYIGHNPSAQAQYSLPAPLDGDIFESMKALAEDVEGRAFADEDVSSYYMRRGLAHVAENPCTRAAAPRHQIPPAGQRFRSHDLFELRIPDPLLRRAQSRSDAGPSSCCLRSPVLAWPGAGGRPICGFHSSPQPCRSWRSSISPASGS